MPQLHGIHQQGDIREIFAAARTNCCGDRLMWKRPDSHQVDHPVVRGQRHDQAAFGLQGFADSPERTLQGRLSSRHRGCAFRATANRQNAISLPPHSALHATERKGHATGEGCLRPTGSAGHSRGFPTHQLIASGWPLISTDSPSARMTQRRLSPICLRQRANVYGNRSRPSALSWDSRPWRHGLPVMSDGAAPVIDACYLLTHGPTLSGNVEDRR